MWFRVLGISFLKWVALLFVSALLLRFVFGGLSGWWLAIPMWAVGFVMTCLFADWALSRQSVSGKELGMFIGIWMVVSVTLQLLYAQFVIGDVRVVVNSLEAYIQFLLEVGALLVTASYLRKKRMQSVLGEGMGG